ncbi:MAG: hypothetical protein JWP59_3760, partial [Massilia sp.]|nr:hypothetical protein [Massilia sp.]
MKKHLYGTAVGLFIAALFVLAASNVLPASSGK